MASGVNGATAPLIFDEELGEESFENLVTDSGFELEEDLAQPDTFERIESKYLAPSIYRDLFEAYASAHLAPCYPNPETRFVDIESLYFDSRALMFFQHHMQGLPLRAKIRLRRYAPDGILDPRSPCYVEVKSKKKGICKKFRIALCEEAERQLLTQGTLEMRDSLLASNPDMNPKAVEKRVKKIRKLIRKHNLVPQMQIRYRRTAFERDGIRMTIDSNIRTRHLNHFYPEVAETLTQRYRESILDSHHFRFSNHHNCVAEIKHSGFIPDWARELTRAIGIQEVRFSKYCWSVINRGNFNEGATGYELIPVATA